MPLPLHLLGHVVRLAIERLRAGPRAVFEDEGVFEARRAHQVERRPEFFVGLAAEAHDEVARDRGVRQLLPHHREHLEVLADRVAPLHPPEHRVRAVLRRHVEVGADRRQVADGSDEVGRHVARVVRDEPDPVEAVEPVEPLEQVGEPRGAAAVREAVRIHGLADQRDLATPLGDELAGLRDDRVGRPRLLRAAHVRHDAERAELVAAGLRAHERLERRGTHRGLPVGVVALERAGDRIPRRSRPIEAHLDAWPTAGEHAGHERRHLMQLPRPHDEIDPRRPCAHEVLILLRHAAEHSDDEIGPALLHRPHAPECRVDLVLGVLPHGARVVEDRVGLGRAGGHLPALPAQRRHDELAVEHVHLAADGLDPKPLDHFPATDSGNTTPYGKSDRNVNRNDASGDASIET